MKQLILSGSLLCLLLSCSLSQSKQQPERSAWQTEYEMIASDSSFSATIDYLPQGPIYGDGVCRLGITPIKSIAVDTIFHTKCIGKTIYYYGCVSVQGSMGISFYTFANAEHTGGLFTFINTDYILTFPEDYEPESFQGKSIDMVVTKSPFDE